MLLKEYDSLTNNCKFSELGSVYTFYYADSNNIQLFAKDCIEIDIKSAFPTICKIMFGEDDEFVKNIFSRQNNIERVVHFFQNLIMNKLFLVG